MPLFEYKAVTPLGETLQGEMEAASTDEVIRKLQEMGNLPITTHQAGEGGFDLGRLLRGKQVSQKDVGVITEQLSTLLNSGLPLDRALQLLVDLSANEQVERMVASVRDQVREGSTLSDALESQHGVFSRLYINMVRAGELGGALESSFERLSDYLNRAKELKDNVVSALIYPILLLVMAVVSLMILLTYVVPEFAPMFEEMGGDLPMMTRVVLAVGGIVQNFWWLLIAIAIAIAVYFRKQLTNPETRPIWHQRFLNLPILGDLLTKIETARFSRTCGTLLVNGVAVLGALSIARKVMTNDVLSGVVADAAEEVKTGGALAYALGKSKKFPKMALQMINVGEETGKLDTMLMKVADTYDREVRTAIDRALALLVPVLTLGLAVLIATIVISILMAIMSVNDLIA